MTCHSRGPDEVLRSDLEDLARRAFIDEEDGMRLVVSTCESCDLTYEEELDAARARVVSELPMQCIHCDRAAELSSRITGMRLSVMLYW